MADRCVAAPDTDQVLRDLIEFVLEAGTLRADAPWSLAASEARRLRQQTGYSPPGGWHGVVGLAAGSGLVQTTKRGFTVLEHRFEADAPIAQALLLGAFTRRLCPPAAFASILVALGVNPLHGLSVASRVGATSSDHLLNTTAEVVLRVETAVFGMISEIESGLCGMAPGLVHSVDFVDLLHTAVLRHRPADGLARLRSGPCLPMMRMLADDLLGLVFAPSGLATRNNDGTISLPHRWKPTCLSTMTDRAISAQGPTKREN